MNIKRILAGLLAIFTIVTQVPQAQITAMAAEDFLVNEQPDNDTVGNPVDEHDHEHEHEHDHEHEHINEELGGGDQGGDANNSDDDSDDVIQPDEQQPAEQPVHGNEDENNAGEFKTFGTISFTENKVEFKSKAPRFEADELDPKERRLYDALKKELDKILAGEKEPDAGNDVYTSEILGGELIYTYEDLGVVVTDDAEDSVTDTAALNEVLKNTLGADLQEVSEALFSEMEGSISWIPAENGIKFERDKEKVSIEDAVIWTVVFELKVSDDQDTTEDLEKETESDLEKDPEKTTEDGKEDVIEDVKEDGKEAGKGDDETNPDQTIETSLFTVQNSDIASFINESKSSLPLLGGNSGENAADVDAANADDDDDDVLEEDNVSYVERTQALWVAGIEEEPYPYQLKPVTIDDLRVYFGKKLLKEGTDYTTVYKNNNKPGTATVTVTGKGNYTGSITKTFTIEQDQEYTSIPEAVSFTAGKITFEDFTDSVVYNGESQYQDAALYFNGEPLSDADYVVSYSKEPVNVGTYTVTYTGIGGYKGSVKKNFRITAEDINNATLLGLEDGDEVFFRKGGAKPEITLEYEDQELKAGTDYTVAYKNNTKVDATGTITITGKGNFRGSFSRTFTVAKNRDSESLILTANDKVFANKAGNYFTTIALTDNDGKKMAANTDYDNKNVVYTYVNDTMLPGGAIRFAGDVAGSLDIVPADTVMRVKVTLTGNYEGTKEATYRITGQDISKATVKVANQVFTGKEIRPDASQITVTLGKAVLSADDYEIVSYENNTDKGTGKLTIRGIGQYGGTKVATFTIAARTTAYSIVFYGNGATGGAMANQQVALGREASLTANKYTRTNYVFAGWNTKADGSGDPYANLTRMACNKELGNSGNVLYLYAQWTPDARKVKTYSINYFTYGAENNIKNDRTAYTTIDPDITIYAPEKESWPLGYQFGGWYKESNFKTRISVIKSGSTGNVNLYAKWIPYSYTVKFNGNGATSGVMADEGFSYGVYKKLNKNAYKKDGSAFLGWSSNKFASVAEYTDAAMVKDLAATKNNSADVVTLYAVWDNEFDINYELGSDDAELFEGSVQSYIYGERVVNLTNEARAERAGYDFAGWYKDAAFKTKITSIPRTSSGDVTVYAKWTPWIYKIEYVAGKGATGKTTVQTVKTEKATIAASGFANANKTFIGWSRKEGAAKPEFYTGELVGRDRLCADAKNGTVTLYAVWGEPTRKSGNERAFYNVIFNPNTVDVEGNPIKVSGKMTNQKINAGQYASLNKNGYSVKGYEFLGWSTEADAKEGEVTYANMAQVKDISFDENGNANLFAVWKKQTYTITYHNVIGEEDGTVSDTYTVDDTMAKPIVLFTPEAVGQTFAGWYSDAALKKKVTNIAKGSTGDKDFYAKWTSNYYTISYNLNDSDVNSDGEIVRAVLDTTNAGYVRTFDSSYDQGYVLATARREGYRFVGWYQDKAGKKPVTFITGAPAVDMTVYAKWTEEPRVVNEDGAEEIRHVWTESTVSVAATCTEDGIEGHVCRYCGKAAPEAVIPATGHTMATRIAVEATYKEEGVSEVYCETCGEVLGTTAIPMLQCTHPEEYKELELISEATCKSYARYEVTCTRCGQVTGQLIDTTKKGHIAETYTESFATYKEEGTAVIRCKVCGENLGTTTIPRKNCDHPAKYSKMELVSEATCTEYAVYRVICTRCDQVTNSRYIDKDSGRKEHTYSWVTTREATDTEDGLKEYKCSICGDVNKTEVISGTGSGCAHPIEYRLYELISPATCVDKAHYTLKCSLCGEVISEDYQRPDDRYNPNNHVNLTIQIRIASTAEETGIRTYYCSSCGFTKEEVIPVKSCDHWHKEVKNIDGKLYWKCTDCGELVGEASPDDCIHGYYGYDYVQRVLPDENTWGETDLVCKNCKTVKQTFKIHPYSEYHVTDENGQDVTLYGWFDDDAAREVFNLTNAYRQENELNKLTYNTTCQDASNLRALEALVYWGHTRPNGTKWNTIISQWQFGGENLAQNQRTPSAVMTAWKNSPGHNANLLYGRNEKETPFKGLSVSCFHQLIIDEDHHYVSLEKVSWVQNFTFYQY